MNELSQKQMSSRQVKVAIIGAGLGGFMAYIVLRFRGLKTSEIAIIGPNKHPAENWLSFVGPIEQNSMRSESAAHFYPTDSPGLATIELFKTGNPWPLIASWFDWYHPTVQVILNHITALMAQSGYATSHINDIVAAIHRHGDVFTIFNPNGEEIVITQNVIVGIGHGYPSMPEPIKEFNTKHPQDARVRHAFARGAEIKPGETVAILGNGLSSATIWHGVLNRGASIVAVAPTPFLMNQPLNTPRKYFSLMGILPYRRQPIMARLNELKSAKRGTFPPYLKWKLKFRRAANAGRLIMWQGMAEHVDPMPNGKLRVTIKLTENTVQTIEVDHVIGASGFMPAITHPLWQQLIKQYHLSVVDMCLHVSDNFTVPALSRPGSIFGVIGSAADWAIPCADSFGGMKIVAHTLASEILGMETLTLQSMWSNLTQWTRLITGKKII